ncbi:MULTISPECIES: hypothetical protein [unclassified Streptomyces]|uniref:hypothetical protein n=1 Tax=unclassified Streptomyces TaxID=2593676 RepID=UPI00365F59F7
MLCHPRPLRRVRATLASFRQTIDSTVWIDARTDRCTHCGRTGINGCDPAAPAHPAPATPGRLRHVAHTARLAWHLRHTLPHHLNRPFANTPHAPADVPF